MDKRSKRFLAILLCLVLSLSLCACGGNVKNVQIESVSSEIYSEKDIDAAIRVIVREFDRSWKGCTLTSIAYAGDEKTQRESSYYLDKYDDASELIVLTSSFEVDGSGGDGSLNPNSTYNAWSWILVRSPGGSWRHIDHGYG